MLVVVLQQKRKEGRDNTPHSMKAGNGTDTRELSWAVLMEK